MIDKVIDSAIDKPEAAAHADGLAPDPLRDEVLDLLDASLSEHLGIPVDTRAVARTTPLGALSFDGLALDSMDLLVLVLAVEERFDCDIDDYALHANPTWAVFVDTIVDQVRANIIVASDG